MTAQTEADIQAAIAVAIRAMSEFEDADVVINDWSILDQGSSAAPYVILENSDDFESRQDSTTPENRWYIPVNLIVRFTDWDDSLNSFRTLRDALIAKINSDTVRAAGGLAGVNLRTVRNDGPIGQVYDRYAANSEEALPVFVSQRIIMEVEEFL